MNLSTMLASFNYRPHHSLIETFDPRARWIFAILMLTCIVMIWDVRVLVFFFLLSLSYFFLSKLTWKEAWRPWTLVLIMCTTMVVVNVIITGAGTISGVMTGGRPVLQFEWTMPLTQWHIQYTLTQERLWFALCQYLRILGCAALFIVIPFTFPPQHYGVTFRGLGLPDKLAFTIDLSFRFVPTLIRDFQVTMDAQRARGFELDKMQGGLIARVRRVAPLFIPVTMNAILMGEDLVNAMDLRCFGLQKRTWVEELRYRRRDYALMAFSVLLLVVSLVLRYKFGIGDFWSPI